MQHAPHGQKYQSKPMSRKIGVLTAPANQKPSCSTQHRQSQRPALDRAMLKLFQKKFLRNSLFSPQQGVNTYRPYIAMVTK